MGKAAVTTTRRATIAKAAKTATPPPEPGPEPEPPAQLVVEMKRKKKKGRPSLLDLQKRQQQQQQQQQKTLTPPPAPPPPNHNSTPTRRSTRRNPTNYNSPSSEFFNNDDDDDDDERQQKKVKLVVRLPQSTQQHFHNSASAADSGADDPDDHQASPRKRMINAVDRRSNDVVFDQGEKALKATDTVHGSSLDIGPTTPLPDKKMLVFVLDRLQKKDTYGAFSEPADPNELPDYHEIIEHPMDFWTLRKKLDAGSYSNLEELEADVMLLCSNAMQYNAPDTIYFRQARSIRELAKRDFENLRNEGDNGEPQPKVIRRGRPPSKNLKKPLESSPVDRVGHELSSGATLASAEDKAIGSNGYNLRKGPAFYRFRSNDAFGTSYRSRNGENYSDWLVDWNSEFPASILRADMKYGKKHFSAVDENRRDTYKQFHPSTSSSNESYLWNSFGDMKRLLPVGLHLEPQAYARSLARYAANLGPVAWNVASRKLKTALPDGLAFGPGWVEENDAPQQLLSAEKLKQANGLVHDRDPSRPVTPSSSGLSTAVAHRPSPEMAEAVRRLNCQNELAEQAGGSPWATAGAIFQAQHKSLFHPNRNGFSSLFGCDPSSQVGLARQTIQAGQSGLEGCSISDQMLGVLATGDVSSLRPAYQGNSEEIKLSENRGTSQRGNLLGQASDSHVPSEVGMTARCLQAQHRQPLAVPPDLNVRVQASASPSSSLQIGSPQQPDLALQL
ncbi:uncharacterized protein [Coffea arabica]|uniref:Bromo domain-containing protein n=1 Tax=Coffea arabica TaxID=13443 RepID=A0ABM4VVD2_COFAR